MQPGEEPMPPRREIVLMIQRHGNKHRPADDFPPRDGSPIASVAIVVVVPHDEISAGRHTTGPRSPRSILGRNITGCAGSPGADPRKKRRAVASQRDVVSVSAGSGS